MTIRELIDIYSLFYGGYDVRSITVSVFHVCGPHTRNRIEAEILPASVPGGGYPVPGGAYAVMKIACQNTVLDHVCLLSWNALIVECACPAVAGYCPVVHNADPRGANSLTHPVRKNRLTLSVEVCLKGMSHGLVQQNSGCSGAHYHRHPTAFRTYGLKTRVKIAQHAVREFHHQVLGQHIRPCPETARLRFRDVGHLSVKPMSGEHCGHRNASHRTGLERQFPKRVVHNHPAHAV